MKTATLAAASASLFASALAQQFVQYTPGNDDTSVQRADPILAPNHISQHVHQIFGANSFSPSADYDSLQDADCTTVGDASNNGNAQDNSIYWHPALFMEAKDGSGYIRVPTNGHKLYYKNAGTGQPRNPFEFPKGFRMLAGNPFIRTPPSDVQQQNITQWNCHVSVGPSNQGTYGGFPTGVKECDAYPGFNGAIHFPHCWNGKDFDAANPTAHISYPTGDIENGDCPASHPTRLPHIFVENQFNFDSIMDKVNEDSFVLAMGDKTGLGWHADFFNGWEEGAIPELMKSCPQGEYGNEDIGLCPSFKKRSISASSCKLKTTYQENVNTPGQHLPGCNPVINTNPAPNMQIAPLGACTNECSPVGEGGSPPSYSSMGASSAVSSAASSATSNVSSAASSSSEAESTSVVVSSTTLSTYAKGKSTSEAASPTGYTSSVSCPASNNQMYKASGGKTFKIQCGVDHYAGNLKSSTAHSLEECINQCASTGGCVDVSLSGTACYMKKSLGKPVMNSGIAGAKLVHSSQVEANKAEAPAVTSAPSNPNVVYVTEVVTVTASPNEKRHERHVHRHLHAHARFDS